ncbi:hypothetical protein FBQ97_11195 [Acidobacteria bacterium ACD]|nr:MAG: hypothetical protein EDX89_01535 [Acidobacteriota bacterium]MCE7957920.1 hypothetical protein [Acidobacteria bacterium ACB2]MDL1950365.1 hypothetical protein [Acidobacteria bacterium ACD]
MDSTGTPTPTRAREADVAAASAHLKESWEHGKEAARDAKRIASESLRDISRNVEQYVESRPKTIALYALGAGLAVGFLGGLLVSRAVRNSPTTL